MFYYKLDEIFWYSKSQKDLISNFMTFSRKVGALNGNAVISHMILLLSPY